MYVFISYSHVDKSLAKEIACKLDDSFIHYFLDEKSITFGDDINKEIQLSMDKITHLIVIISPASLKSQWVPYEVGLAEAKGAKIIPFIHHPSPDLPGFLANRKGFSEIGQIATFFKAEDNFFGIGSRPKIDVPDYIASVWSEILAVDFPDNVREKKEVWVYFEKWREVIKDVSYEDYTPEHAFYKGTEHYLMGYLSHVIKFLSDELPREEVDRYRKRTVEAICNGRYPQLEF